MKHLILGLSISIFSIGIFGCAGESAKTAPSGMTKQAFEELLGTLAEGWYEGDARKAVACFTRDAAYIDPPDKQVLKGHDALYAYFGGDEGRAGQMKMVWHRIVFDETRQIGMGEFTFEYGTKAHGMVIVKVRDDKISNWREYWYESELEWDDFVKEDNF